ncbi:MAG: hypothetical protein J7J72_02070 [Bacteroidales bacterium]|nr:hypothetical protein [Bacteroidales bacterium]
MKKIILILSLNFCLFGFIDAQVVVDKDQGRIEVNRLMDSLWINPSSFINYNDPNWIRLKEHLVKIDILQLNELIHSVFYGRNSFILNKSHADVGFVGVLNRTATDRKLRKYHKKIRRGFRDVKLNPNNKLVLIEGDSWFEYPVFLNDITDYLEKKPELAIYSLASGSDWVSNMISNLDYEYTYVKILPDVFIISGGGNDFVGDSRLSSFLRDKPIDVNNEFLQEFRTYTILRMNDKPVSMCSINSCDANYGMYSDSLTRFTQNGDTALVNQIVTGRRYLNKNFYRWMASVKLEYKMLFESLRLVNPDRFKKIKILTQGYDYAIPSFKKRFGFRMLTDNGEWLKEPLMVRGIIDPYIQKSIVASIIFEINEMMIELGKEYKNIYHVDSRGLTAYLEKRDHKKEGFYWYDELHPKAKVFSVIANTYADIINGKTNPKEHIIRVIDYISQKQKSKR